MDTNKKNIGDEGYCNDCLYINECDLAKIYEYRGCACHHASSEDKVQVNLQGEKIGSD